MEQFVEKSVFKGLFNNYVIGVVFLVGVLYYVSLPQAPIYGQFYRVGGTIWQKKPVHEVIQNEYDKLMKKSGKPFVVRWWAKDYIILPAKYLPDLKTAPRLQLHFFKNISDALFIYTTVGDLYSPQSAEYMIDVVRKGLNPRLPQLVPAMVQEVENAFERNLGVNRKLSGDGITVNASDLFDRIGHQSACRIMIGKELCRDDIFLRSTMGLLRSIFITALVIVNAPLGPLRNSLAWPLSLVYRWKLYNCKRMLKPVVAKRLEQRHMTYEKHQAKDENSDAIEWTLDLGKNDPYHEDLDHIANQLLHNLWAASSAPGGMITEVVYQLLFNPEYIDPIRSEAEKAVREFGWSEKMLSKLYLQDSFIREVNRMFPTGSISCARTVVDRPFRFSDGLTLPIGSRIGFPTRAIQNDSDTISDPLTFHGFRFAHEHSKESSETESARKWSSTTMATTNLAWGYGNHVCPGRFWTVRNLKLVLSKLLIDFDVSWNRDEKLGRPKRVNVEGQFVPDMAQKIHIKPRKV